MQDVAPSPDRFAVGQPVPRTEDPRLLRGAGRYTDDLDAPEQVHAHVFRSAHAHGRIVRLDTAAARAAPGVFAVLTGEDIAVAGLGPLPFALPLKNRDGSALTVPEYPALARERVFYVGQPVAMVVAETSAGARDAADAIELEIEPLPAVVDARAALAPDAPVIHETVPGNLAHDWEFGDGAEIDRIFASAHHVARLSLRNNRIVVAAMEPRACLADYDPRSGRYTLHVPSQGVFGPTGSLAEKILHVPREDLHMCTHDVGGSFGMKGGAYPEYVAALLAARKLGRPVKWRDERSGSFVSDTHGRDSWAEAALAFDADGRLLAGRVENVAAMGAFFSGPGPLIHSVNAVKNFPGGYRLPKLYVRSRSAFTNTTPIGAYRGAGRPEGVYYMERLMDTAAREMGTDPVELRRRNLLGSDEMPHKAVSNLTYDSGDFPAVLTETVKAADWDGFAARRADSEAAGRLRGRGIASYLEVTAPPNPEMGGIRFEEDGRVTMVTGTLDYGQGHRAPFAQVVSARLGVPFEALQLVQGDSDALIAGGGTGGSRSIMSSGTALLEASDLVIENGKRLAAHVLEAAEGDIEFSAGAFSIAGTDRSIDIMTLAKQVQGLAAEGVIPDGLPESLDAELAAEGVPSTFPNGCHVAEVEIDPETGAVTLVRYVVVDDFGTLVNPLLVEGQVHGGVAQGVGQALLENAVYDESGQLLTGSFMDYTMPRADDLPSFSFASHPVPATTNPLGVKGCGEAGTTAALPAVTNAVVDALHERTGALHVDMPVTAEKVWRLLTGSG